ncbi:MAG TPA: ABC transporter ATP-binding protein [Saliniramus sp.]|nr:ABC transporter ATP-binding protein [Saliniramus sp.]
MQRAGASAVVAENIGRTYDGRSVLSDISLTVGPGEIVALLGPSGCGKTTFLRIVAGLVSPDTGVLHLDGRVVADGARGLASPPEKRGLGMVFQDYALWPHLSVVDNVAFPLRMRGVGRAERRRLAHAALDRVGLAQFAARTPGTLSGGQQQRVALARAVVAEPPLVLFDEPLSNLDRELRESLALDIRQLLLDLGLSAIYVTHDQSEAFTVADRVAVMHEGRIAQIAEPETLFRQPVSIEVARFLNIGTILPGEVSQARFITSGVSFALPAPPCAAGSAPGGPAHLLVPRAAIRPVPLAEGKLRATVARCQFQGDRYLLHLTLDGKISVEISDRTITCSSDRAFRAGEAIGLDLHAERLLLYPASTA